MERRKPSKSSKGKSGKNKHKARSNINELRNKRLQAMEGVEQQDPEQIVEEELEFEDDYEDEFEEEEVAMDEDDDDAAMDEEGTSNKKVTFEQEEPTERVSYYAPRGDEDEELDFDMSAYGSLHQLRFEWPALSFDFLRDHMGMDRTRLPTSLWMVCGTQAEQANDNEVSLYRVGNFARTKALDEADDHMLLQDNDEEEGDATMESREVAHRDGAINRVRAMPQEPGIVATWSESGKVHLFDCRKQLQTLDLEIMSTDGRSVPVSNRAEPIFTFAKHQDEGFALGWSSCSVGRMASGDCTGNIHLWNVTPMGVTVDPKPFTSHQGSVEDIQFSDNEECVFATCGVDGTVRIWDARAKHHKCMLTQKAHEQDVNVLSWNRKVLYLLASGSDDASFKVWDLRQFSGNEQAQPVGWFKGFHTDSITSIEWSPHDESVICCSSADHQTTVWDLALEEDREFALQAGQERGFSEDVLDEAGNPIQFPPQLLFVHAGVKDPKEVHFHPQITGLVGVTGSSGFDLFICEPLDPKSKLV